MPREKCFNIFIQELDINLHTRLTEERTQLDMISPLRGRVMVSSSSLYQCTEVLTMRIKTARFFCFDNFSNNMKEVHITFIGSVMSVSLRVGDVHSADLQFIRGMFVLFAFLRL